MTATLTAEPVTDGRLPAFARWPVLLVAGLTALAHAIAGAFGDYWIDEVYMLAIGEHHPSFGYADQPPLAPLIAAAMDGIAPGSMIALRLPAALATGGAVLLTGLLARELGAPRRGQALAAFAAATGLWTAMIGHFVAPYTFEPVLWLAMLLPLVRWLRQHARGAANDRLLLVFGALLGINLLMKFQVALLCLALLIGALAVGPRAVLARPKLWLGAGIALVLASPTLIWQALHGWPQLRMASVVAREAEFLFGGRTGSTIMMVGFAGILGSGLVLVGTYRLLTRPDLRPHRLFAVAALVLFVFFVISVARPYYVVGLYGVLLAAAVVPRNRPAGPSRWGWAVWPVCALSLAAAGALLNPAALSSEEMPIPVSEKVARDASRAYTALPPAQRERTAVLGESYILAAMVEVGQDAHELPAVHSPHRGYGYFPRPGEDVDNVVFVGRDPAAVRGYFDEAEQVSRGDASVWVLTGRHESWATIWPRIRHL
ncbi:glycosyltransferase family 39 protein [Saccharopolyspora griseoalba]|uniref:Glycosyltransferase family 39 protein n=1 Tax=Saccharopolyspora griseoalba TaxID=1431848 RepID=A0ABW2LNX9_9PSEU